jgi:hypothetical protein
MLIKSLDKMEKIVSSNKTLSWDGWDVIQSFPSNTGWQYPNGAFIKGRWYTQKRFPISSAGWDVPNKWVI